MTTTMANLDTLGSLITAYFTVANDDWRAGFLKAATPPNGVTPQNNANGELAAHLADLKKSEALGQPRRPEFANNLEQLNSVQGDILNRLRTLPAFARQR